MVQEAFRKSNYSSAHFTNTSIVFGTDVKKTSLNAESYPWIIAFQVDTKDEQKIKWGLRTVLM